MATDIFNGLKTEIVNFLMYSMKKALNITFTEMEDSYFKL